MSLTPGLYDLPVTRRVARALEALAAELAQVEDLDPHELPLVLARHLQRRLVHAFAAVPRDERASTAVDLANRLLADVHAELPRAGHHPDDDLVAPARKRRRALEALCQSASMESWTADADRFAGLGCLLLPKHQRPVLTNRRLDSPSRYPDAHNGYLRQPNSS